MKKLLTDIENCTYLEHEALKLYGYTFFGTPYVPPIPEMVWGFQIDDLSRKQKFCEIPGETDILISHSAPKNILDAHEKTPHDDPLRYGCPILTEEVL